MKIAIRIRSLTVRPNGYKWLPPRGIKVVRRMLMHTSPNHYITNIIAHKGRIPCAILTKFTGFIRVLSLHNLAKFGCFSLINDNIINNLPRWGRFQPNFRWPLAAKLLTGPKKSFGVKWWHGPLLSPCKFGGNRTTHVCVRGQKVMFFVTLLSVDGVGSIVSYCKLTTSFLAVS